MFAVIAVTALVAGIVQGTTGFGLGIVMMLVLPFFLPVAPSAAIAVVSSAIPDAALAFRYRKSISLRKAALPAVLEIITCSIAIFLAAGIDNIVAKKFLGGFLIVLAVYFLFFSNAAKPKKLSRAVAVVFIVISGICDGLFAIGGPLMVIYFLSVTDSIEEYIGTMQLYFLFNIPISVALRIANGMLGPEHAMICLICVVFLLLGLLIAKKLVKRLDEGMIRRLIYIMIAIAGLANLLA